MKRIQFLRLAALAALAPVAAMTAHANAGAKGTPAEAEAMVKKVVAYIKANGQDKAFETVNAGTSFKDRDLYVFIYDFNGKCLAHGVNPKLVGKDLIGLKDPDGKPLIKMNIDLAKEKGAGWTDTIKFRNPTSDKLETKRNYIERVGDILVGSGVYVD